MNEIHLVVLAGGFGTRLRSAVPDMPKPLAPIFGMPFLHYQLDAWERQGASKITFLLHYEAEKIQSYLRARKAEEPESAVIYDTVIEPAPLGTGGAISHAIKHCGGLGANFFVVNADTWLGNGLGQMLNSHSPALGLVQVDDAGRYGQVAIESGRVISFHEKQSDRGPGWINAGVYHLTSDLFERWDGQPFSLERDLFPKLIQSQNVSGIQLDSKFIDIGIPEDYRKFCAHIAGS